MDGKQKRYLAFFPSEASLQKGRTSLGEKSSFLKIPSVAPNGEHKRSLAIFRSEAFFRIRIYVREWGTPGGLWGDFNLFFDIFPHITLAGEQKRSLVFFRSEASLRKGGHGGSSWVEN